MLYLYPGLTVFFGGAIVGWFASFFVRPGWAAAFGRRGAWGVALTVGGAVLFAFALPDKRVSNGPIGATCPDTESMLFDVLVGLAVASLVAGAAVVAASIVESVKRAATGATVGRVAFAVAAPYVALAALFFPLLCDYS
jgi:hypothetical protein